MPVDISVNHTLTANVSVYQCITGISSVWVNKEMLCLTKEGEGGQQSALKCPFFRIKEKHFGTKNDSEGTKSAPKLPLIIIIIIIIIIIE